MLPHDLRCFILCFGVANAAPVSPKRNAVQTNLNADVILKNKPPKIFFRGRYESPAIIYVGLYVRRLKVLVLFF